jgi:hypothetical protein
MASNDFIAVTADDWYQRRRQDDEGEFFRKVANQAGKDGGGEPSGGSTRQGIYCFTADGTLLAYKNAGQAPDVMREVLRQALTKWSKLPEDRRKPGAIKVDEPGKVDAAYQRTLPANGLVLNVYTRILDHTERGDWCRGTCKALGGDKAARDHMWLTEAEWRALVPAEAAKGDRRPLLPSVAQRLVLFHLIDNTRGEPPMWEPAEVRKCDLALTVTDATAERVEMKLEGAVLLSTGADPATAARGFDLSVLGYLRFDRGKKGFDRFDIVAVGNHWGNEGNAREPRPGRMPLGVCIELAKGDTPADKVPPQAARHFNYLKTGR